MIEAIIFDMDGVLIDSMDAHFAAWSTLLKPYTNLSKTEFMTWAGKSTADIFGMVKSKYGVVGGTASFIDKKDQTYLQFQNKLKLFPGVKKILANLKYLNLKVGIATSESTMLANQLLEKFQIKDYFLVIVGGDMVEKAKPNPDLYLLAAKMLNVSSRESLVIEDTPTGIEAAKAAGMKVVGITNTLSKKSLAGADAIINKIDEITAYLEK